MLNYYNLNLDNILEFVSGFSSCRYPNHIYVDGVTEARYYNVWHISDTDFESMWYDIGNG